MHKLCAINLEEMALTVDYWITYQKKKIAQLTDNVADQNLSFTTLYCMQQTHFEIIVSSKILCNYSNFFTQYVHSN